MSIFFAARCAFGAVALFVTATADAGFVFQSASRETEASAGGIVVQTAGTLGFTSWFGSARANTAAHTVLATQGSNLLANEMTFVGAAQVSSTADATLAARSAATVTWVADATETVRWIADLWHEASGAGNAASISMSVVDLTDAAAEIAFSGPVLGSGSFAVDAGHTYRVQVLALAGSVGATNAVANYNIGFFTDSLPVPGPGAIALLALAGLAVRRRR